MQPSCRAAYIHWNHHRLQNLVRARDKSLLHQNHRSAYRYHITPFAGAYLADVHLGRFKTICLAVFIALVGHITLIFAAVPGIIEYPDTALPIFLVSLVVIGLGGYIDFPRYAVRLMIHRHRPIQGEYLSACCGAVQTHQVVRCYDRRWREGHRRSRTDRVPNLHVLRRHGKSRRALRAVCNDIH